MAVNGNIHLVESVEFIIELVSKIDNTSFECWFSEKVELVKRSKWWHNLCKTIKRPCEELEKKKLEHGRDRSKCISNIYMWISIYISCAIFFMLSCDSLL